MSDHPFLERPLQTEGLPDDALEEINRLWTIVRAFSTTAHDVNNALQVIAGSAELLESRDLDPAIRRRVEAIRVESGKAAQTIDRLLSYARAPRQPAQSLDLWTIVDSAVALRMASLGRLRIALSVDRSAQVPVQVSGQATKVLQALLDLLLIAEDNLAGRARARIAVRVGVESNFGYVTIETSADHGERTQEGSADVGRTAETLTKDAQGWAAARIARAHGGEIVVDEATLTLRWPLLR